MIACLVLLSVGWGLVERLARNDCQPARGYNYAAAEMKVSAVDFVRVEDSRLVVGADSHSVTLKGLNYYPGDHAWATWREWDEQAIRGDFQRMADLGSNTARVFVTLGDWQQGDYSAAKMDTVLRIADTQGMRLLVTLFDGYRKYPAPGWDAWPGADDLAANDERAYLKAVVAPFAGDPRILGWDLSNEPDVVSEREWLWLDHASNRLDWLTRIAAQVRALDGNHPLTVGLALAAAVPVAEGRLTRLVDFISFHYYSRNYPGRSLRDVLLELRSWTDKPLLVEEAGQSSAGEGAGSEEAERAFYANTLPDAAEGVGLLGWTLHDFPNHAANSEGHYGLYRSDDTAKPAITTFRDSLSVAPFAPMSLDAPPPPACE